MNLPERINVMKLVSYDVQQLLDDISEHLIVCENRAAHNFSNPDEITIDDLLDWISGWVDDLDFGDFIFQDENGNDL